jgi:hypothetical protein
MDLFDSLTGQTETSRRALIRGAVVGIAGLTGCTTTQTGGEQILSYLKDDSNDDEEPTVQSAELSDGSGDGDGTDGTDGSGGGSSRGKQVVSQVDLTERDGRVTLRLGAYERVIADYNTADGNSTGSSAWRVDGKRAARSGVSFRAREGDTLQLTLQNPTPIPYSLSIRTDEGDGSRVAADSHGVTVYAGETEQLVLDGLAHGEYAYEVVTTSNSIDRLGGWLLVDS